MCERALAVTSGIVPLSRRRRLLILAVLCSALLVVSLDATIVNIALPSIGRDFHASISGLQWIVDAYTLVVASLLMLSGSTGDRIGRRRIFMTGLCLFCLGSLLCSLAPGLGWLIAFRALQAIGGSMLTPAAISIVRNVFTDPRERAQAIGFWGATFGASMALGPTVGGVLVQAIDWRAIFWINLPIGVVALVLARMYVPESRAPRARRLDPVGQALVIGTLTPLTFAIIEGPRSGWGSPEIIATFAIAIAAAAGLVHYEGRRREPLLELRFFRSIPFSGASVIAVATFAALGGFLLLNTLYLQEIRGYTALEAGACLLPMALMVIVLPPLSGWLVARDHARVSLAIGGAGMAAGALLLTGLRGATVAAAAPARLSRLRRRRRFRQRPDHEHRRRRDAARAGRRRRSIASTARQVGQTLGWRSSARP